MKEIEMDKHKSSLLFVDDEPMILEALKRVTRKLNSQIFTAESGIEALEIIKHNRIDVIISDINMPNMNGITLLSKVAEIAPEIIRIILTAYTDIDNILSSINEGKVWGYLKKPWDNKALLKTLNQVIDFQRSLIERTLLKEFHANQNDVFGDNFSGFVGGSEKMQAIYQMIKQCAPSKASVFITGPSGSGKEVAAQALHDLSGRNDGDFIAINCAAIPSELMESEMFGHIKGAFSGAINTRDGAATLAHNGTLFLDEIGEMDILLQAKLLRFIQTGSFSRVGSSKIESVNVRFISATNREPEIAIAEKKLREDLYYRLNVLPIDLPPLKERGDDVVQISEVFLQKYNLIEDRKFHGFTPLAKKLMRRYEWPGNVRQLQNVVYSAIVVSKEPTIDEKIIARLLKLSTDKLATLLDMTESDLVEQQAQVYSTEVATNQTSSMPSDTRSSSKSTEQLAFDVSNADITASISSLASVERSTIEHAINCCNDNVVQAAEALGVSPSTLYRKIQQWHGVPLLK